MIEKPTVDSECAVAGISDDLPCPICGYNLRGVARPRCPECGFEFTWDEMSDPRRRLHPYLFEHHPERNFWSYWRTLLGGLWPRRFWTRLHPLQRVDRDRLILYWKTSAIVFVSALILFAVMMIVQFNMQRIELREQLAAMINKDLQAGGEGSQRKLAQFGSIQNYLDATYPLGTRAALKGLRLELFWTMALTTQVLAWPWLSYVSLISFRQSMKRVDQGRAHVLRCCIYAFDILTWSAIVIALANTFWRLCLALHWHPVLTIIRGLPRWTWASREIGPVVYAMLIALIAAARLHTACRKYMQFPDPLVTVGASQILASLMILNILVLYVWLL